MVIIPSIINLRRSFGEHINDGRIQMVTKGDYNGHKNQLGGNFS